MLTPSGQRAQLWPTIAFWLVVVAAIAALEIAVRPGWLSPAVWARPSETAKGVYTLFTEMSFATDVWRTLARTGLSLLIGYPLGMVIAIGMYCLGRARPSGELALDFIRSIPLTALVPLFLVIYGPQDAGKIAIGSVAAALVTAVTMWVSTRENVRQYDHLIHLYGPSLYKQVRFFILPHCGAAAAASLRLAVSNALVLVIVSEMFIGTQTGIGRVINDSQYSSNRGLQWGAVAISGFVGYGLNRLVEVLARTVLPHLYYRVLNVRDMMTSTSTTHPASPTP
jgi:sulfonate transport system permease protein